MILTSLIRFNRLSFAYKNAPAYKNTTGHGRFIHSLSPTYKNCNLPHRFLFYSWFFILELHSLIFHTFSFSIQYCWFFLFELYHTVKYLIMDVAFSGLSNSSERSTGPVINRPVSDATNRVHPYRRPPLASSRPSSRSYVRSYLSKLYFIKFCYFFTKNTCFGHFVGSRINLWSEALIRNCFFCSMFNWWLQLGSCFVNYAPLTEINGKY